MASFFLASLQQLKAGSTLALEKQPPQRRLR